jgi:hypothetical protein
MIAAGVIKTAEQTPIFDKLTVDVFRLRVSTAVLSAPDPIVEAHA